MTHPSIALSREAGKPADGRPLYLHVRDSLVARITSREWNPGESLPSEQAMAAEYGVSLGTARKAVDLLVADKILVRRHGSGTYVATYDWRRTLSHVFKLVDDDGRNRIPEVKMLEYVIAAADGTEARKLQIRRGAKVVRAMRLRMNDEQPFIVERLVLPVSMFRGIEEDMREGLPSQLYEHFSKKYGFLVKEAVENLRAVAAEADDARLLDLPVGHPLLEIDRVVHALQGFPMEWRISRCNTRHHSYQNRTT